MIRYKSQDEIRTIRRAAKIVHEALLKVEEIVQPGVTLQGRPGVTHITTPECFSRQYGKNTPHAQKTPPFPPSPHAKSTPCKNHPEMFSEYVTLPPEICRIATRSL